MSIYGSTVTSFVQLNTALTAGTSTLSLGSIPTGWKVGDRLVITGDTATDANGNNQDEELAIEAINGSTITLGDFADSGGPLTTAGLKYNHSLGSVYISDVTRNVAFSSESVAIGDNTIAHRGHVMFMHNPNVHVIAAGFYGLGRTDKRTPIDDPVLVPDPDHPGQMTTDVIGKTVNTIDGTHRVYVPVVDADGNPVFNADGTPKLQIARTGLNPRGRYAVHFHRTGSDAGSAQASISDSAVVDSPGWGIVNHSSNVDVSGNVVFNATGAAYVTEAGDETGSFDGNIAIHSQGSGDGIESRRQFQDFGHEGVGFWLQGGNVSVTNNVVAGQRSSGYVFFPVGLDQKGLGITTIDADTLADPSWAHGQATVAVGDVPLRKFSGNVAFASGDGFESWFSLLNVTDGRRTVVENFSAWKTNSAPIFDPYTANMTFKNVTLTGNLKNPQGKGFDRNDVTSGFQYIDVNVQGFSVGIDAPINGQNVIQGGTFNDIRGVQISTARDRGRTVDFTDMNGTDPINFLTLDSKALRGRTQSDIYLNSNFNPMEHDITTLFNPDVIKMGTVRYNGKQLYYLQQGASYVPFPSATAAPYIPPELLNKTNQQIYDQYGLAIGGVIAPPDATASDPRINALIGSPATYLPDVKLTSAKYYNPDVTPYVLSYKYQDPTNPLADKSGWVSVKEKTASPLHPGWNLLTRNILGHVRTVLVYSDDIPPTFQFASGTAKSVNLADIENGSMFVIQGNILDDSFGSRSFFMMVALNDPKYFSGVQTAADGSRFITLSFVVKDFAGNATTVKLNLPVTQTSTLQKDLGRKNLPTIRPSHTLQALLARLLARR